MEILLVVLLIVILIDIVQAIEIHKLKNVIIKGEVEDLRKRYNSHTYSYNEELSNRFPLL